LIVLRRKVRGRAQLTNSDRWFFIQLYRWFPLIRQALTIIRPETLVRWNRIGFRGYWRWKSRPRRGRPEIETDLRALIRRMSTENPLSQCRRANGRRDHGHRNSGRSQRAPPSIVPTSSAVDGVLVFECRFLGARHLAHRVPGPLQVPGNLLDCHAFGEMLASNLRYRLRDQHPVTTRFGSKRPFRAFRID
jgi:hypothetical protein